MVTKNNRKFILLHHGGQKSEIKVSTGLVFPLNRRILPYLFQLLVVPGFLWVVTAWLLSLPLLSRAFSVSLFCVSYKDTCLHLELTQIIQDDFISRSFTWLQPQRTLFQIRSYLYVSVVKTWIYLLGHHSTHYTICIISFFHCLKYLSLEGTIFF